MKQRLLGNRIGRAALWCRNKIEIVWTAYSYPENVGALTNDQLATQLVTTICQPHKTFINVGAHIGSILAEVAHHDPSIRLVGIEAIPQKIVNLRKRFPSVEFHECAAGDSTGEVSFFVNVKESGYSSLGRLADANEGSTSEIRVPIRRLDELVSSKDVDVIAIDVEGAELGVLRGSMDILNSSRPIIMFESGPQEDDGLGYTKEALFQFLNQNGYTVLIPNRVAHNGPGLTQDGFIESHQYPRRTTNYFAIPTERRIEIRDEARRALKIPNT